MDERVRGIVSYECAKCGAEIKEGCIYCSVCGNAVQIVPDYSVLEDDYLRSLLKEEESAGKEPAPAQAKQQKLKQPQRKKKSPAAHFSSGEFCWCFSFWREF